MALEAAALALAAALGMSTTVDLGLRAEVRGLDGGPRFNRAWDPVPWEVVPSLGLTAAFDPRFTLAGTFSSRLLLLAPEGGGYRVHSAAEYLEGTLAGSWRPTDRLALGLSASAAGGRQATSTLAQLAGASAGTPIPGQPGGPPPTALNPGSGVRTGRTSSFSGLGGAEWRPSRFFTLGGTISASRSGEAAPGDPAAPRPVFPLRELVAADAYGSVAPSQADTLFLRAGVAHTRTDDGRIAIVTLSTRWEQRHTAATTSSASAGVAATVRDTTSASSTEPLARVAPSLAAAVATAPPIGGTGVGASLSATYAPYVDPYVARVRQRLSGQATADWQSRSWLRIGGAVSGAISFGGSRTGPGTAGGELGFTVGRDDWEVGLAGRAAYQEADPPAPTVWQYGLVLRLHLRERSAF